MAPAPLHWPLAVATRRGYQSVLMIRFITYDRHHLIKAVSRRKTLFPTKLKSVHLVSERVISAFLKQIHVRDFLCTAFLPPPTNTTCTSFLIISRTVFESYEIFGGLFSVEKDEAIAKKPFSVGVYNCEQKIYRPKKRSIRTGPKEHISFGRLKEYILYLNMETEPMNWSLWHCYWLHLFISILLAWPSLLHHDGGCWSFFIPIF